MVKFMNWMEIALLIFGAGAFVGSFLISGKSKDEEEGQQVDLELIRDIIEKEMGDAKQRVAEVVDETLEYAVEKTERASERISNEKIMAISEYSDTVVESMNKTHNEIMFLYSMLNDKHAELTDFSAKLNELAKELEKKDEAIVGHLSYSAPFEEKKEPAGAGKDEPAAFRTEIKEENFLPEEDADDSEESNHNADILALHKQGKSAIDIARELALGLGEVQLVIGLYEGKRKK